MTAGLDELRARGWVVAVHNDYALHGLPHTFWLFTRGNLCAKGEGTSDEAALAQVLAEVQRLEGDSFDARCVTNQEGAFSLEDEAFYRRHYALARPDGIIRRLFATIDASRALPQAVLRVSAQGGIPAGEAISVVLPLPSPPEATARPRPHQGDPGVRGGELDEDAVRSAYYNNHVVQWLFGKLDSTRDELCAYQEKAVDACVAIRDELAFDSKHYNTADQCADAVYAVIHVPALRAGERSERAELRAEVAALKEALRQAAEDTNAARTERDREKHGRAQIGRSHDAALRDLVAANLVTVEVKRELDEAWKATGVASTVRGSTTLADVIAVGVQQRKEVETECDALKADKAILLQVLTR